MDCLNLDRCREILTLLPETFDSHDFIFAYLGRYERDYVALLSECLSSGSDSGIFLTANSKIARFLSDNKEALGLALSGRLVESRNIKNNITPNHQWKKL